MLTVVVEQKIKFQNPNHGAEMIPQGVPFDVGVQVAQVCPWKGKYVVT